MEELFTDNKWKPVKIVKVDVDNQANWPIAQKFQVSSIPAVFVIKNGEIVDNIIGANPKDTYQTKINELLG